jgi:hypothetical protein
LLPRVHNASVSMTIPFKCSPHYIRMLFGEVCHIDAKEELESSALAAALFHFIKIKFTGSPADAASHKVDSMTCAAHGENFVISWNTQGSGTAIKKTIGTALKNLKPGSLFTSYSSYIRMLGHKPQRPQFLMIANKMIAAINSSIEFVIIGKFSASLTQKVIYDGVVNKFQKSDKLEGAAAIEQREKFEINYPFLKCSNGAEAIIVSEYIRHNKIATVVCGSEVAVYSTSIDTVKSKLGDSAKIKDYVKNKITKLGEIAPQLIAYHANSSAYGAASDILKLFKEDKFAAILDKNLK